MNRRIVKAITLESLVQLVVQITGVARASTGRQSAVLLSASFRKGRYEMKPNPGTAASDTSPSNAVWPMPKRGLSVAHGVQSVVCKQMFASKGLL